MIGRVNTGGGGTKSVLIVTAPTGSTVAMYDSSYSTMTKMAVEKTAGQYWFTGLNNGTYYIKATQGMRTARKTYTISEFGVYRIVMAYSISITLRSLLSSPETISYTSTGGASGSVSVSSDSPVEIVANPNDTYTFASGSTAWADSVSTGYDAMDVNCYFGTPLFWYGVFTSGFSNSWTDQYSAHSLGTSIAVYGTGSSGTTIRYCANNTALDLSEYQTLGVIGSGSTSSAARHKIAVVSSNSAPKGSILGSADCNGSSARREIDISEISSGYFAIGGSDNDGVTYVNALWLE